MYISKIHIENFKGYKELNLELKPGINIIVGDNETRKTTILEAINLVLSGYIDGKYLTKETLNQFLFNKEITEQYLSQIKDKDIYPPPLIIELFFSDDAPEDFLGINNHATTKAKGVYYRIGLSQEFEKNYRDIVRSDRSLLDSLPLEFYDINLGQFSGDSQHRSLLPIKSSLIDNASNFQDVSDLMISKIIKSKVSDEDKLHAAQFHRKFKDTYKSHPIHETIKKYTGNNPDIDVSIDPSAKNSWDSHLSIYLKKIPFSYIGKGQQIVLKTDFSLSSKKTEEAGIILIEEPENHLSFSTLNVLIAMIEEKHTYKQIVITSHSSFVANKLGLENIILLDKENHILFSDLEETTQNFFKKLPGYDTLRLLLCKKAILVEGDADELLVQRAYMDLHEKKLPIQSGIDVISVNNTYDRFLQIAKPLLKKTALILDVDSSLENREALKSELGENSQTKDFVRVFFEQNDDYADIEDGYNNNTLEPLILKYNDLESLNKIFGTNKKTDKDMLLYMRSHKSIYALKIFESSTNINYPKYILEAIKFIS